MLKKFKQIPYLTSFGVFLILFLLLIPSFWQMLRPGLFSMHDFYPFRLFEFNKCIQEVVFPCRWAPDAGWGYGEPVFNFYPQLTFFIGEVFVLLGLSIVNTTKLVLMLSLLSSGIAMFLLSRFLWKSSWAGILSAVLYVYAPYRAVDVWVRGAVPEAFAFVFFPLIILFFELFITTKKNLWLYLFSLSFAGLALTHSVSLLVFSPFFFIWGTFRLYKGWNLLPKLILGALLAIGIAAFQLIPILFETKYTLLGETTKGYFDYQNHFATPYQLFISNFWGWGNSVLGSDDTMSFALGHFQWLLPLIALVLARLTKSDQLKKMAVLSAIALFSIFMIIEQSTVVWRLIPSLAQLQFPWRFLSISVFILSLISGFLGLYKIKYLIAFGVIGVIVWNLSFFKEEKWYLLSDEEQFIGGRWDEQRAAALPDFWPKYGSSLPNRPAEAGPTILLGEANVNSYKPHSHSVELQVEVMGKSKVQLPIVYFPGWEAKDISNNTKIPLDFEPDLGRITLEVDPGVHQILVVLQETSTRKLGNIISALSLVTVVLLSLLSLIKINLRKT